MSWDTFTAITRLIAVSYIIYLGLRRKDLLALAIGVLYLNAIIIGTFLNWPHTAAIFSTPLAFCAMFYVDKHSRR